MPSGIFFQSPAVLVVPFNAIVISFQAMFFALNRNSESQCRNITKEFPETLSIMLKLIRCKIKFLAFLFCFEKLVIEASLYICINFLSTRFITAFFRRESVNPKLCFPIFAYPSVELLFFILLTNSSMLILPLNSGICFMLKSLRALPYFLTQL